MRRYRTSANLEWLKQTLSSLNDDLTKDWREYPCLEWPHSRMTSGGYGNLRSDKKLIRVHRFAFEFAKGPIPPGHNALHHCDNPPCFRPVHLFSGTDGDNMQDKKSKGRSGFGLPRSKVAGEKNPSAKLTNTDVRQIRFWWPYLSQRKLANVYGVEQTTIGRIVNRKNFKDLP